MYQVPDVREVALAALSVKIEVIVLDAIALVATLYQIEIKIFFALNNEIKKNLPIVPRSIA